MKRFLVVFAMAALGFGMVTFSSCTKDDTTAPTVTLKGDTAIYLNLGSTYTEPGYTANDDKDGVITTSVTVIGTVNVNQVGMYMLTYKVADKAGNEASAFRSVYVKTAKLAGNYHVSDVVTGKNAGTYTYDIEVDSSATPGSWWRTIVIKNFGGFGNPVVVSATIDAGVITIPEQTPSGMAAGWEAKITGSGTYDGASKSLKTFSYTATYLATGGGADNGVATLTKF
ncbi:MAG: DUF5011 domain-containing protein [Bacteroidota bacterium]